MFCLLQWGVAPDGYHEVGHGGSHGPDAGHACVQLSNHSSPKLPTTRGLVTPKQINKLDEQTKSHSANLKKTLLSKNVDSTLTHLCFENRIKCADTIFKVQVQCNRSSLDH